MELTPTESVNSPYERMRNAMIPLTQKHSVPIAAYYNGELRQHATGSLVQFADHYFLITAAHAIEDFDRAKKHYPDIRLYIDNGDANDLVPLDGKYTATEKVYDRENLSLHLPGERNDLWDIALWELGRRTVEKLTNKEFLNRYNIAPEEDLTRGIYFLAGCPCSWSKTDSATNTFTWKWLTHIGHPCPETESLPFFDSRFHIALQLDDNSQFPKELAGISGGAIWKLADAPIADDWSVDQARLVAIETCVLPSNPRAIRGTNWKCVIKLLGKMRPDIRDAFRLWLPGDR